MTLNLPCLCITCTSSQNIARLAIFTALDVLAIALLAWVRDLELLSLGTQAVRFDKRSRAEYYYQVLAYSLVAMSSRTSSKLVSSVVI